MLRRRTDRLEKIAAFCALGVAAVLALAGTVEAMAAARALLSAPAGPDGPAEAPPNAEARAS